PIQARLRHADATGRYAAAKALAELGPRARCALPALLRALRDKEAGVRASAAGAVGPVAAGSPSAREAVAALAALLKDEKKDRGRSAAVRSLRCFGADAWATLPALREGLSAENEVAGPDGPAAETVAL